MTERARPVLSLVVATKNRGKLAELRALIGSLPIEVLSLTEGVGPLEIDEDQKTFAGNARKKAEVVAKAAHAVVLADDSGLEVDVLGGQPGVRSARFAGEGATDAENNAELLRRLEGVDPDERTARFRCAIALVDPWADEGFRLREFEGSCEGRVALSPRGTGGFGYDPLFIVKGSDRTFAEHSEDEKNLISHRARAFASLMPELERLVAARMTEALAALSR